ncbi:MAG: CBS domain-containing protein [Alphaproteobacteria bacterium]
MRARDIMTTEVVTVAPSTAVSALAQLLVERRISAVPVVEDGELVGLVSEGDLLHREETGTEPQPTWWKGLFRSTEYRARAYLKAHGQKACDVMTTRLITVGPDAEVSDIAELMERHRIKRVPVVEDGRLVGIVARGDLLRILVKAADHTAEPVAVSDQQLAQSVLDEIQHAGLATTTTLNVIATDGTVGLWGFVATETERQAVEVAARSAKGCKGVDNHLAVRPPYLTGAY